MNSMIRRSLVAFLILSLLVHVLFYEGLSFWPASDVKQESEPIEITVVDPDADKNKVDPNLVGKQIVEQEQRLNDEKDENAKYLSKHDQKVLKETKATQSGKFQNRAERGQSAQKPQGQQAKMGEVIPDASQERIKEKPQTQPDLFDKSPESSLKAFKPDFRPRPQASANANNAEPGSPGSASQTDDYLKDINLGVQTLLSTREFVYYSYYNRIKEKLRQHWEPTVREKVKQMVAQGRNLANSQDRITRILIVLDSKGQLIRAQIVGQSGVQDLDEAAVEAFRAAAPFPNPPKGIIEPDGTIKIRWDFVLEASATFPIRFQRIARK